MKALRWSGMGLALLISLAVCGHGQTTGPGGKGGGRRGGGGAGGGRGGGGRGAGGTAPAGRNVQGGGAGGGGQQGAGTQGRQSGQAGQGAPTFQGLVQNEVFYFANDVSNAYQWVKLSTNKASNMVNGTVAAIPLEARVKR